jgi:DNA-binding transcriptional LysR family regulator
MIDYHWLMIQLYQLEGFYRVAVAGGYARAAREFPYPITQPGVHAQVRRLEREIGARLFEQAAKDRSVPTRAGRTLLAFCAPFFEELPNVVRAVGRGAVAGRLRIQAGALEIQEILPAWMRRVRTAHPDIEVELGEIDGPDYTKLFQDEIDLIVDHQPHVPRGVSSLVVARHYSFLVAPAGHPLVRRKQATPAAFSHEPFVAFSAHMPHQAMQFSALRALGAEPRRVPRPPSVASILSFVAAGLGYSLVPWPAKHGPRSRGVAVIPLRGKGTSFPITASWRTSTEPDAVLQSVLRLARGPTADLIRG